MLQRTYRASETRPPVDGYDFEQATQARMLPNNTSKVP